MTQEVLKLSLEALAGLKDVEKQVRELVAENKALKEALAQPERPAPCAKHCEATAFQITIKNLEVQLAQLKPLTDEDIKKLWVSNRAAIPRYLCFARAIEAKLKEKNT